MLVLAFLLDALIGALFLAVIIIAITGGGVFTLGSTSVSARSVGNPLLAILLLGAARVAIARPARLEQRCADAIAGLRDALVRRATRPWPLLLVLAALALGVKLANAWWHDGFFSGDDVEIHEMTLARVLGMPWPAWELRSAFYPMVFIYPVQALLAGVGVDDVATLVAAGRSVVAVLSTAAVFLVYRATRDEAEAPAALIAAFFAAMSPLLVTFGGTELPRPIAAVFLVGAYVAIGRRTAVGTTIAGACIAVAAALRFSEIVYVIPAIIQLGVERRWRDAAVLAGVGAIVAGGIQAAADYWYWGSPFFSLRHAVDYTLVAGQSTRGFQPPWFYLTAIPSWSDLIVVAAAVYGAIGGAWRPALWAGLPLVLLSALPHKEPRYLIPVMPFVAMLAGIGVWRLIRALTTPSTVRRMPHWAPLALCAALAASTAMSVNRFHVQRSDAAVRVARAIGSEPGLAGIGVEQLWRWGGRLYLSRAPALLDLDGRVGSAQALSDVTRDAALQWIALRDDTCDRLGCDQLLRDTFDARPSTDAGYKIFRRR